MLWLFSGVVRFWKYIFERLRRLAFSRKYGFPSCKSDLTLWEYVGRVVCPKVFLEVFFRISRSVCGFRRCYVWRPKDLDLLWRFFCTIFVFGSYDEYFFLLRHFKRIVGCCFSRKVILRDKVFLGETFRKSYCIFLLPKKFKKYWIQENKYFKLWEYTYSLPSPF